MTDYGSHSQRPIRTRNTTNMSAAPSTASPSAPIDAKISTTIGFIP